MRNTSIEWTDNTFNPWEGCNEVSVECDHCYAAERDHRFHAGSNWGKNALRLFHMDAYWKQPQKWDREAEAVGKRHRVFCGSLCDVMEDRPELHEPRLRLYRLIEETPHLDWILLTKRPQNFQRFLPKSWLSKPQPNVWGMTTAGVNSSVWRVSALLEVPFVVYGVSMEPLLEPMEIPEDVDWVILGGESGAGARPRHVEWLQHLVRRAGVLGVTCFVKQLGTNPWDRSGPLHLKHKKGGDPAEWPADLRVRDLPNHQKGLTHDSDCHER